jgi:hypothetical protein
MRYVVFGVMVLLAFFLLWPIVVDAGHRIAAYFRKINKGDSK